MRHTTSKQTPCKTHVPSQRLLGAFLKNQNLGRVFRSQAPKRLSFSIGACDGRRQSFGEKSRWQPFGNKPEVLFSLAITLKPPGDHKSPPKKKTTSQARCFFTPAKNQQVKTTSPGDEARDSARAALPGPGGSGCADSARLLGFEEARPPSPAERGGLSQRHKRKPQRPASPFLPGKLTQVETIWVLGSQS